MPRIEELVETLATATYITTLDLTKGYWQVPVAPEARAKTAFVTPFGKYHFLRMPFGLTGAPAVFQRMMDHLFEEDRDSVMAYIDDIAIHSDSWTHHLAQVEKTVQVLQAAGLTLKPSKCRMAFQTCEYLGHQVGGGKIRPCLAKVEAIEAFKIPKRKKDIRSFLGLASYYRKYVPGFSTVAAPLSDLTRTTEPDRVRWSEASQMAFLRLKAALTSEPVLHGPDYNRPFVLQTDASDVGIGAVLSQLWDGDDHPVAYFSRKLLSDGRSWTENVWRSLQASSIFPHSLSV